MSSNNSQKRENLLNMSLDVTRQERMSSPALSTGYDPGTRTWELIVRYSGDLSPLKDMGVEVKELLNGYAILNAPEELVETVSQLEQIQYMEKPKLLYFAVNTGRSASCLTAVQSGPEGLSGEGVLTAVIDSGIDYFHPDFRTLRSFLFILIVSGLLIFSPAKVSFITGTYICRTTDILMIN